MAGSGQETWVKPALIAASVAAVSGAAASVYLYNRASKAEEKLKLLTVNKSRESAARIPSSVNKAAAGERKPVRIYMDGVFDLMHYGHSNALRQAKAVGDILVVGLVNDAEVIRNKGTPPVMPEEERYISLSACKWVDEVIRDAPYDLTQDWVTKLVTEHNIDYIVHGDDPCITADGTDAYAYAKSIGKYKQIKRTEGVSTTDIVGRMLLMSREHHTSGVSNVVAGSVRDRSGSLRSSTLSSLRGEERGGEERAGEESEAEALPSPLPSSSLPSPPLSFVNSKFLPTARRIMQFADGRVPRPEQKVVYMCGAFDLFNAGHIAALQEARKLGDFLLVGIHDDVVVNSKRGHGLPILNLYERTLSLLSCKFVDEVIIGAPWEITEEMITTMNISAVVHGDVCDMENREGYDEIGWKLEEEGTKRAIELEYAVPARLGILKTFKSPRNMTALNIINRILAARSMFQSRYDRKSKMEDEYVKNKEYVVEH